MKKQFFYAAFAIAMMASCTSEDTPLVEQPTAPEDDRVAIELGIDSPTITASSKSVSRGTGSVGDVADQNNVWNGQQLFVTMINRADGEVATEEDNIVLNYDTQKFYAPEDGASGSITFIDLNNPERQNYVYYPISGTYDFYGWHLDDATGATVNTTPENSKPNISITGITINGTQDIMGAKTKPAEEDANWENTLADWAFSARTARAGVKPVLKFDHQLARLKFFVRAGSHKTAVNGENGVNEVKLNGNLQTDANGTATSTAMYVTSLVAQGMHSTFDMTLTNDGITTSNAANPTTFTLGSIVTEETDGYEIGEVGPLTRTAPEYLYDPEDDATKGEQVGESIIFLPVAGSTADQVSFEIELEQLVPEYKVDDVTTYFKKAQKTPLTIKASSIVNGAEKKFKAGHSYNIYITIYGFEQIEVSAELTAWEEGGDVDVDIEEGVSKHDVTMTFAALGENETINPSYQFYLCEGNAETALDAEKINGLTITVPSYSTVKYVITAPGYEEYTGYANAEKGGKTVTTQMTKSATPATYTVTINAPQGATVTINGQQVSTLEVEAGTDVTWSVEQDGYESRNGTIDDIAENKTLDITLKKMVKITGKAVEQAEGEALQGAVVTLTADGYQAAGDGSITVPEGTEITWTVVYNQVTYAGTIDTTDYTEDQEKELVCDESSKQD